MTLSFEDLLGGGDKYYDDAVFRINIGAANGLKLAPLDHIGCNDDDSLWGGNGNDTIHGGEGNDRLDGDSGNEKIKGGSDDDRINWAQVTTITRAVPVWTGLISRSSHRA